MDLPQNSFGQYYILESLKNFYEVKVLSFNSYDPDYHQDIFYSANNSNFLKILNLIFCLKSSRLTHYWSDEFFKEYKKTIVEYKPDILYVDNILMMQYPFKFCPNVRIWLYDDESNLFSKVSGLRKNIIEKFRNIRLERYESKALNVAEKSFCITDNEVEYLNAAGYNNVKYLPYPVSKKYYYNWSYAKKSFSVLFVGDFAHYPNKEAAKIICYDLYPTLKSMDIRIVIVGRNLFKIRNYLKEGIESYENVADIREFYWTNSFLLAPIYSGGGMRIKILEAAACGIPIIMTPLANLGINLVHEKEAIITNDISEMVEYLKILMRANPNKIIEMSKNANDKIVNKFSLDIINRYYISQFEDE